MKNIALKTAGIIFGIVSITHWARYFREVEIIVNGYTVHVFFSLIVGGVILALSVWMFVASRD